MSCIKSVEVMILKIVLCIALCISTCNAMRDPSKNASFQGDDPDAVPLSEVIAKDQEKSTDPAYYSAESSSDHSEGRGDVAIVIPTAADEVAPVGNGVQSQFNLETLKDAGCIALAICGAFAGLFVMIGVPMLLAYTPSVSAPLCQDICKNNTGYYAPINGTSQYAYVYCNGTTDGEPRKRRVVVPIAAVVAAGHGNRNSNSKSTPKPRTPYKDGYICEEAVVNYVATTILETASTSAPETTDTLPPLVKVTPTTE